MSSFRTILIFLICTWITPLVHAQQLNPDSLQQTLNSGSEQDRINSLLLLGQSVRNSNPTLAIQYYQQAWEKSKAIGNESSAAKAAQSLGGLYFRNGNYENAKSTFIEALSHYQNARNNKGVADVTTSLANTFYAQGNLVQASQYYLNALRYYEEVNDNSGMVTIFSALSTIYARQNNFSKSTEYSIKATQLFEKSSDKFRALVGYDQIGNSYLRQNDLSKARQYFRKSLQLYTELKNEAGIASTLNQLGDIEFKLDNIDKSYALYNQAYSLSKKLRIKPLIIAAQIGRAKCNTEKRQYNAATQAFQDAIALAKSIQSNIELEEAYQGLSLVYERTQQTEKSRTFDVLSKEIRDSLYNDSTRKKLNDQLLIYESEKKEQQIELLNKEQLLRSTELKQQQQFTRWLVIASLVLGILLTIVFVFFIQNRRIANDLRKQQHELIEKNQSILEQKEKLDQLNTVKDRFFSIISHDLRNNLTTMKLYFDLISNEHYVATDHSEITRQISGSVENTIDLLENLLVWASAQIKGIPIHIQPLDLVAITNENIALLNGTASQKQLSLENHLTSDMIAKGDLDMINLVMRNLISNAIKFTPEKGKIDVYAGKTANEITVEVRDNGVGIGPENLEKLFHQHNHPSTKGTGNEKGTGLGLLLCKDFIERNGGKIWVESNRGKGASFFFTLPVNS